MYVVMLKLHVYAHVHTYICIIHCTQYMEHMQVQFFNKFKKESMFLSNI